MTKQKENTISYLVMSRIFSIQHNQEFEAGSVVTWDLSSENLPDFETLKNIGVIADYKPEESSYATNSDNS